MSANDRQRLLFLGDLAAVMLGLLTALLVWKSRDWIDQPGSFLSQRVDWWFYLLPVIWLLLWMEMYDLRRAGSRRETFKGVLITAGIMLAVYLVVFFLAPSQFPRLAVGVLIGVTAVLILAWRLIFIAIFTLPDFQRRALIIGAGRGGSRLAEIIDGLNPPPFKIVGFIDDDPRKISTYVLGHPVLGGGPDLMRILERERISDVIFAITHEMRGELFQTLLKVEEAGIPISTMPAVYEQLLGRVPIALLQSDWLLRTFFDQSHADSFYELTKRLIDIVGGLAGTLIYLITFPLFAIIILIDTGAPVLYRQTRLGMNGREYLMIKYRTMYQDSEKDGSVRVTVENDQRITKIGKFLRKSHLDELPQFVNVLRGEMSLVGPRAERSELVNYLQSQVPFYRARLLVRPGITGWAQINFGYAATVEDTSIKLEHDLFYIKHRNMLLDLMILIRTFGTVFGFKGQ